MRIIDTQQLSLDFDPPPRRLTFVSALPSPRWIRFRYRLEDCLGDEVWDRDDDAIVVDEIRHHAFS
jgi:hypothetical protein